MHRFVTRRGAAGFVFVIGFLLMFLGSAFLIGSFMGNSQASVLLSFFLIILGISCAVFAIRLNWRSLYLFFAALFLQAGFFLLLYAVHIISIAFRESWPLLSVFAGIALLPAGWHRYGKFKANYVVPSAAFIVLGSILMIFALDLVAFSLRQFILNWWPLLVVLAGFTLILISLATKSPPEPADDSSAETPAAPIGGRRRTDRPTGSGQNTTAGTKQ